jgi:SAM-dependent methyltransferase
VKTIQCAVDHLLRATATAEARHFWFRGFRAFISPLLRHAASKTQRDRTPRILDCGCGTGANLVLLGQFGHAYGFDLAEIGVRFAHESGRRRVARASVDAAPFPSDFFDLVTSFDVLYSLESRAEQTAVTEMYRLLRPGGFALVNVAAMNVLTGDHSVLGRERRRYTRRSLRQLLEGAGFEVVRLTYTNASLFVPLLLLRTFQRWRGLSDEAGAVWEITVPPPAVNALLTAVVRAESLWVRRFDEPFGSSLLCLARKPGAART